MTLPAEKLAEIEKAPVSGYGFRGKPAFGRHEPQVTLWKVDRDALIDQLRATQAELEAATHENQRLRGKIVNVATWVDACALVYEKDGAVCRAQGDERGADEYQAGATSYRAVAKQMRAWLASPAPEDTSR